MTLLNVPATGLRARTGTSSEDSYDWLGRLAHTGPSRDEAVERLHVLLLRAARYQVAQMHEAHGLGQARREEIIHAAADEAAMSVLSRLGSFEGRSKFTTWAYKFGILQAAVEVRRAVWRHREIDLDAITERACTASSPSEVAESSEFVRAVTEAIKRALTPHQRRVVLALLVEGVPIDVLADRLNTNRNALYKALHDARKRLRADLTQRGFITDSERRRTGND